MSFGCLNNIIIVLTFSLPTSNNLLFSVYIFQAQLSFLTNLHVLLVLFTFCLQSVHFLCFNSITTVFFLMVNTYNFLPCEFLSTLITTIRYSFANQLQPIVPFCTCSSYIIFWFSFPPVTFFSLHFTFLATLFSKHFLYFSLLCTEQRFLHTFYIRKSIF